MQQANKQTAVSEQRLGKHVPAETNTHATTDLLLEIRCSLCGPLRGLIKKRTGATKPAELCKREAEKKWRYSSVSWVEFCTDGCDKRTWARKTEKYPLLETAVRERLVKIQQAGKSLSRCCDDLWIVEISGGAVITCSTEWCKSSIKPFTNPYPVYSHPYTWQCNCIQVKYIRSFSLHNGWRECSNEIVFIV
jgi:hypothetical protein